jgi:hypothetical protein
VLLTSVAAFGFPAVAVAVASALHLGPEPPTTPFAGALPTATDANPAPAQGEDADGDGLDDALEAEIARRHAPRYRFTARDPNGPDCLQNQDEEHFPMSVARFLAGLERGAFEVRGQGKVQTGAPGHFEERKVVGYPSFLAGDPPGEAPLYTHVYPGVEGEAFVEYWVWYGYDRAQAAVVGVDVPLGDHRGDWEHSAYRVSLDPPRVLEGYYYGHALCLLVPREDMTFVDGEHPEVFVGQGKHASYPAPVWVPSTFLGPLVHHHDLANGLGPTWDAWKGTLVDLGERDRPRPAVASWQGFQGRWGPDGTELFGLGIGTSPTGPTAKTSWGNNYEGTPWREHVLGRGGEVLERRPDQPGS